MPHLRVRAAAFTLDARERAMARPRPRIRRHRRRWLIETDTRHSAAAEPVARPGLPRDIHELSDGVDRHLRRDIALAEMVVHVGDAKRWIAGELRALGGRALNLAVHAVDRAGYRRAADMPAARDDLRIAIKAGTAHRAEPRVLVALDHQLELVRLGVVAAVARVGTEDVSSHHAFQGWNCSNRSGSQISSAQLPLNCIPRSSIVRNAAGFSAAMTKSIGRPRHSRIRSASQRPIDTRPLSSFERDE